MTRLTIVVPCYNEAPVLHETTKRLLQVADTLTAKEVQTHILYAVSYTHLRAHET